MITSATTTAVFAMALFAQEPGNNNRTVPLRPITFMGHVQQLIKRAKYVFARYMNRAVIRQRIKEVEDKHLTKMRAEGLIIVYHRNGWSCNLRRQNTFAASTTTPGRQSLPLQPLR